MSMRSIMTEKAKPKSDIINNSSLSGRNLASHQYPKGRM